ncbi:dihydropteroate synthase [Simiduia aestuariiviva]|uniref:Dihydropteroate synthase n=2 Tax=Simiduia aestuariiviva TaxID=1510459 RepID=A0A839UP74_9GAMM|nr:dihydropteroate synthase [Simiduia aestuariiviva]
MSQLVKFGGRELNLGQPHVMGIINITPDSFSDGGRFYTSNLQLDRVVDEAAKMVAAGATFLDVGGESTRPGAASVTEQEELERVIPVIETLASRFPAIVSVDTSRANVMVAAAKAGATLINDVRALTEPGALAAAASVGLPVCLMHMQGNPQTMQAAPTYSDVVVDVQHFLRDRMQACIDAGIGSDSILLDPGFGFGKSLEHNLALFRALPEFSAIAPVLVGVSRKTMVGAICDKPVDGRLAGSLGLALLAAQSGAAILRVHDVAETCDLLKVLRAVTPSL